MMTFSLYIETNAINRWDNGRQKHVGGYNRCPETKRFTKSKQIREVTKSDFSNDVNSCIRFLLIFVSKLIIFGLTRRYGHLTYFDYFDQYRCWIISIITRSENAAHSYKFISFITRRLLELTLKRFVFAPFFPLLSSLTYCIHIEQRLYTTEIPRYLTVG